jgi:hypothetical protein
MGNSGSFIDGVVDVPCAKFTITGSASDNFISGSDDPFFPLCHSPCYAHHQVIAVLPVGRVPPSHDVGRAAHPYTRPRRAWVPRWVPHAGHDRHTCTGR